MVYANAAGIIHGLKYGSCRFWQRNDLTPDSNKLRMVYVNAAGLISWRSNMLRPEIQPALRRAPRQLRRLRLGLQTRAGHGPDGAHANRCAYPAVEKFCRASSAGGRLNLQSNFANQIVSVAEDCQSPAGSFHGCSLMHYRGCFRRANRITRRRAV